MARGCCVCPVTLECFLLPSKRKKTQLRLSLNSIQGAGGTDLVARGGSAGTWVALPVFPHLRAGWGHLSARALGCVLLGPPRATSDARGGQPHPDCEATAWGGWWGGGLGQAPAVSPALTTHTSGRLLAQDGLLELSPASLFFSFYSPAIHSQPRCVHL